MAGGRSGIHIQSFRLQLETRPSPEAKNTHRADSGACGSELLSRLSTTNMTVTFLRAAGVPGTGCALYVHYRIESPFARRKLLLRERLPKVPMRFSS